jgi:hypothetical protein
MMPSCLLLVLAWQMVQQGQLPEGGTAAALQRLLRWELSVASAGLVVPALRSAAACGWCWQVCSVVAECAACCLHHHCHRCCQHGVLLSAVASISGTPSLQNH